MMYFLCFVFNNSKHAIDIKTKILASGFFLLFGFLMHLFSIVIYKRGFGDDEFNMIPLALDGKGSFGVSRSKSLQQFGCTG